MELQHFSHTHPLIFKEECSHESDDHKVCCSGCGELLSGPSFSCVACGFYLHKQCAEAPVEMNHPFHPNHSFALLQSKPSNYKGNCLCDFCDKICEHFVYHCSCGLDLHIKCALLSYNIVKKGTGELQHVARMDPLISTENHDEELKKTMCFACWKPLLDSVYLSPDCGFFLHTKCVDLSVEINHPIHRQHPLLLQFNSECLSCEICQNTPQRGFSYCCPTCNFLLHIDCAAIPTKVENLFHLEHPLSLHFVNESLPCLVCQETEHTKPVYFCSISKIVLHIECVSTPSIIEDKTYHEHPFILFHRQVSFTCNACGTSGNYVPYFCPACGFVVHKKCISLPRTLKHPWHSEHPISHTYFLKKDKIDSWECRICHMEDVDPKHGNYYCSKCKYIVHVNCAIEAYNWYIIEENTEEDLVLLPYSVIKETKDGVATEIKHFSHQHNLLLSNDIKDVCCDGCVQFISTSFYFCSQCNFYLHKSCVELPMKKRLWVHHHTNFHSLSSHGIFKCGRCFYENSGFAYTCKTCSRPLCIRCALVSDIPRCEGHEHSLPYYQKFEGLCNACGDTTRFPNRCKRCDFNLHSYCLQRPLAVQHKCDTHLLRLTYGDINNYSEYHYCDVCEKKRNPNHWFYYCAICDTVAHPECVIGEYSFIKLGSIYTKGDHPHPLIFVQKVHYYPECSKCSKACLNLSLECKENGCSYIVHWNCIKPF